MQSMCVYFVTKGLSNVSFVVVSAVFELVMSSIRSCDVTYFEYSGWCDCELCMREATPELPYEGHTSPFHTAWVTPG